MSRQLRRFKLLNLTLSLVIIAASAWAIWQRQAVIDWWRLQTYRPPADVVQLADQTSMIGRGRDLFFVSMPSIEGRETFNQHCSNQSEHTIVLGCYRAQQIYVFEVTDPRLQGVKEVTAAHEMLHAAYERLSSAEKNRIDALLSAQLEAVDNPRIIEAVQRYKESDSSQFYNEMHSVLGTEFGPLSEELEAYYAQYFSDRQKIVGYSEAYEAVFSVSEARVAELGAQLAGLKQQIDANNTQLENAQIELQAEAERLNQLRENRDFEVYNAAVPGYNQKASSYNDLIGQTKQLISQYNALVQELNREAAAYDDLHQSLNSRYEAVPTE